jgi:putative Holliday junction resolvase
LRVIGLDLGTRRIGVAVSDPSGTVATPHAVVERSGDEDADRATIAALVESLGAERVVVGLPRSLDGTIGPAARAAIDEVAALAEVMPVPVETHDERLTTVTAERVLSAQQVHGRARRRVVDKVAAAVILQSWLDTQSSANRAGG